MEKVTKTTKVRCMYGTCVNCDEIVNEVGIHNIVEIDAEAGTLERDFVYPPFSYLDTKDNRWLKRRNKWKYRLGNLSDTREETLGNGMLGTINKGTSNFDPVLAELCYKWFCPKGSYIIDPFAGEQTKGGVAAWLGYNYVGIDIRQEQVDLNNKLFSKITNGKAVCLKGDSSIILNYLEVKKFNFLLTSPPYYDLEIYSKGKGDLSAFGSYREFLKLYARIIQAASLLLKDGSFAVYKVGEIRKKSGEYYNFVGDTIKIFLENGFKYYNEFIMLNALGTVPFRVRKSFTATRKCGKLHQNILVFYKGEMADIGKQIKQKEWYV